MTQKKHSKLHKNVKTENDPWCLEPQLSQLLFGQISKVRTVLKSFRNFFMDTLYYTHITIQGESTFY